MPRPLMIYCDAARAGDRMRMEVVVAVVAVATNSVCFDLLLLLLSPPPSPPLQLYIVQLNSRLIVVIFFIRVFDCFFSLPENVINAKYENKNKK